MPRGGGDASREPCPNRIVDDAGGAFAMGVIGGSMWHGVKGYRNSPIGHRFRGSLNAIKTRGPILGGNFAVWGGLFTSFDCGITYIRDGTQDPINAIASGFLTGGVLAARGGPKPALTSAVFGGVLLALIEGASIMLSKTFSDPNAMAGGLSEEMMKDQLQQQQRMALEQASKSSETEISKPGWWSEDDADSSEQSRHVSLS